MSFPKRQDITENCDDNHIPNNNSHTNSNKRTDYQNVLATNSATICAQTTDNTVSEVKPISDTSIGKTTNNWFESFSQTVVDSSDDQNNELIVDQIEVKPILKRKSLDETEIKTLPSILKKRDSFDLLSKQTILKRHSLGSETDQRNPSLLLSGSAVHEIDISSTPSSSSKPLSQIHSILKFKSFDEKLIQSKDDQNLPKPILKKNLSIEESIEKSLTLKTNGTNGINSSSKASPSHSKSILKTGSEDKISTNKSVEVKSILKKNDRNDSKPVKSALKKSDQTIDSKESIVKSILKSESIGSNEKINMSDTSSSSSSSDEDLDLMSNLSQSYDKIESNNNNSSDNHNKSNGNSVPAPNSCAFKQNDENKANQRFLFNNKKLDQKRPSSCIIMSTTKPIEIDGQTPEFDKKEAVGQSISDRLAALKRNGEENWKKRVSKADEPEVELRVPTNHNNRNRSKSIADRLSLLEDSSLKWMNRVEEKDNKQFTVEAKMMGTETPISKSVELQRKTPKAMAFRSEKTAEMLNSILSEPKIPKLTVTDVNPKKPLKSITKKEVVVSVPKPDDNHFDSFFSNVMTKPVESERLSDDIFDDISTGVSNLLINKKAIKPHNRRTTSNPIRRLAARTDFTVESYTESTSTENKSENNLKPKKSKDLVKSSSFAASALAGLASREDIKAVAGKLRSSSAMTRDVWKSYDMPNSMQTLMLVQIKGRRRAQTRLVEPKLSSINSGDSYILVTRDEIFVWIGQYSNIIERTKTLEIANQIQEKKDLCFRSSNQLTLIDFQKSEKIDENINKLFLKQLNSSVVDTISPPKSPEEDEIYEEVIIGTNLIYHVNNEQLVPNQSFWGKVPKYEMLTSEEAFVFDFGPEMYVWVGNKASNIKRKCALDSAKDLWNKGYNYSECDVNPFGENAPKKAKKRPEWGWFMKVSQNMESVLFKDKFVNWPSTTTAAKSTSNEKNCLKPIIYSESEIDVKAIIDTKPPEPDMILETSHLGRGVRWDDDIEGRHISISTLEVKCWQISEYEKHELSDENKFCLFSGDTYVVRWHYRLSRGGRQLKTGNISRHSMIGRDRTCYFFWHGINTKNTEKGALALMTIDLDKEKAQQVRVSERKEEPCFLNLFKGSLVILRGKRGQKSPKDIWKMFYIRGLLANEASLVEVECKVQSLRSRTAFVFINSSTHVIYVWNGSKCLDETRVVMKRSVDNIINHKPSEIGLRSDVNYSLKELEEGKEDKEFWNIFPTDKQRNYRKLYYSLLETTQSYSYTPRLFNLSSSSGVFKSKEILCSFRSSDHNNPYPFLQEDIYSAQQPTFFLFDNRHQIFLWESKFAFSLDPNEESEANTTVGSVNLRWNAERKCALDFALDYCYAKNSEQPPNAYVVCAGLEPDSFCALFPEWKYREDVATIHIEDGRKAGEMVKIQELLFQLRNTSSTHYTLEELRKKPEGLNPLCLESYLLDPDFKEALGMSKEEFYGLPTWKQTSLKQKADLF